MYSKIEERIELQRCSIDNIFYDITTGNWVNEIKLLSGAISFGIIVIMTASWITSFVRILANVH